MPRFILTKLQTAPENRVQEFPGVRVDTYEAKSPGAPGELEIAVVEADSLEAAQRMVEEIDRVLTVEEDIEVTEDPVEVVDAEPVQASGYSGSYVTPDVLRVMGIDKLYDQGHKGKGRRIGVVDSPFHTDSLKRLMGDRYKGGKDFSGDGINGPKGTHGTFCAIYASAPEAELMVASGLGLNGSGRTSACIEAVQWLADNGCTDITASLGSEGASSAWKALADKLKARNISFGASAGNNGCGGSNDNTEGSPGMYADYCNAASDHRNDEPASFSSCGPDIKVTGAGVRVQLATGDPELDGKAWSGTSMSCPVIMHGVTCVESDKYDRKQAMQAVLGRARDTPAPAHREGHGWFDGAAALASLKPAPAPSPTTPADFGRKSVTDFYQKTPEFYYKDGTIYSKFGPEWKLTAVPGKVRK